MALIENHYHINGDSFTAQFNKQFKQLKKFLMDKFADVKAEFETLKTDIANERTEIAAKLDEQTALINQLQTNILDGGTQEERAQLIADIKDQQTVIRGIIPNVAPPVEGGEV